MGHAMGAKGADACAATTSFEGERQSGAGQSIQAVSGAGALSDQGVRPVPARRMFGRPLAGGQHSMKDAIDHTLFSTHRAPGVSVETWAGVGRLLAT